MKKFSNTQVITKKNLKGVPRNKPGVYRIRDASGEILFIGKAREGWLDDAIWTHRSKFLKGTQFQYRVTMSEKDATRLQKREIREHILPGIRQK